MQILLTFSHIHRSSAFLFPSPFRPLYRLRGGPFLFFQGNPIARSFSALPLLIQNKEGVLVLDTPSLFFIFSVQMLFVLWSIKSLDI